MSDRAPVARLGLAYRPIRLGAYANFSSAPDIPAEPATLMAPKVDLFGLTGSVGYVGEGRALNLGCEYQAGSGYDVAKGDFLPNSGFHR